MDMLPMERFLSIKSWLKALVIIGCASFIICVIAGLTCLFTYMRVSHDYEVLMQEERIKFLVDIQSYAVKAATLGGEIKGYQTVIGAFAKRGRRKSLGIFTVTAYDPKGCEPFNDGVTSIGLPVGDGIFAVDPKKIPYGSLLYIPKISKYGIAGDTGFAMRNSSKALDVFIPVRKDALAFGRQKLELQLVQFD